jgi:hypothetical protein
MEIVPPSFTGDENAARCDESAFKYTWMVGNAAVLYDRLGFRNILNFGFSYQGDYLLALAEERRAARQEASGKIAKHRKEVVGEYGYKRTARWKHMRIAQNF